MLTTACVKSIKHVDITMRTMKYLNMILLIDEKQFNFPRPNGPVGMYIFTSSMGIERAPKNHFKKISLKKNY